MGWGRPICQIAVDSDAGVWQCGGMKKQKAITLKDLERRVKYARAANDEKPDYEHVHIAKDPTGCVIACATDGHRIAFARTMAPSALGAPTEGFGLLSGWASKIGLGTAIIAPPTPRTTTFGRLEALEILARLGDEGDARNIEAETDLRELINAEDIRVRRARVALLRNKSSMSQTFLTSAEGRLTAAKKKLASRVAYDPSVCICVEPGLPATIRLTTDPAEKQEVLPLSGTGGAPGGFRIGVAVPYLSQLLSNMRDDIVGMRTQTEFDPLIFAEEGNGIETIHVLMPVRL